MLEALGSIPEADKNKSIPIKISEQRHKQSFLPKTPTKQDATNKIRPTLTPDWSEYLGSAVELGRWDSVSPSAA